MKIIEKIKDKQNDLYGKKQPALAFLGDSVTHGCFEIFVKNEQVQTAMRIDSGYPEKVKKILNTLYPTVPLVTINAGISGDNAANGAARLERDVLSYKPDFVTVCYGLNDSMQGADGLDKYKNALCDIFARIQKSDAEAVFITPNLRTDKIDMPVNDKRLENVIKNVVENELAGWGNTYISEAKKICAEHDVPVCDCMHLWQSLKDNGVEINELLSNRVNHPTEAMHWLFAYELVRMMFLS